MLKSPFYVGSAGDYKTYAEAELGAKRLAVKYQTDYTIFQAMATALAVVPAIDVVKLDTSATT
jgi:hypothetical protein